MGGDESTFYCFSVKYDGLPGAEPDKSAKVFHVQHFTETGKPRNCL